MNTSRIHFRKLFIVAVSFLSVACSSAQQDGWSSLPSVLSKIVPPQFPDREFVITSFGAVGDSTTDCTKSIRKAIDSCSAAGGGRVVVPRGIFLTGAIHLKSNVDLHLSEGAILRFSTDPGNYLPVVFSRWEGVECMNYSPLIYAFGQKNIAVTGSGILDGQGSNSAWWPWKGKSEFGWKKGMPNQDQARKKLLQMGEGNIPVDQRVFGEGSCLRPNFVQPYRCSNVLISGVTFRNSPMWFLHPVLCTNVTIENVTVEGLGPNNDGCDPESCSDVLIRNCSFNTGDDCIAIKSGRNNDGRRVNMPSSNIVVQGCTMKDGHGGVVIGSEISGSVRNVFAENCLMDSPQLDRAVRLKTNSVRGGVIENLFVRNIHVGQVADAVLKVDFFYEEGDSGTYTPVVRNISLQDVTCKKGKFAIWAKGYDRSPIEHIRLTDCDFEGIEKPNVLQAVKDLQTNNVMINGKPMK